MQRRLVLAVAAVAVAGRARRRGARRSRLDTAGRRTAAAPSTSPTARSPAAIGWTRSTCEGAVLWQPGIRQRWLFRVPGPCPATSTGRGVSGRRRPAAQRVAFLSYVGGNTREWRLWTATPTAQRPRLLRTASADADAASPILLGNGGEEGIPYAVGRDVVVLASQRAPARCRGHAPADVVALNEHSRRAGGDARGRDRRARSRSTPRRPLGHASYTQPGARDGASRSAAAVVIDAADGIHLRKGSRDAPHSTFPPVRCSLGYCGRLAASTRAAARSTSTRTSASRTSSRAPSAPGRSLPTLTAAAWAGRTAGRCAGASSPTCAGRRSRRARPATARAHAVSTSQRSSASREARTTTSVAPLARPAASSAGTCAKPVLPVDGQRTIPTPSGRARPPRRRSRAPTRR